MSFWVSAVCIVMSLTTIGISITAIVMSRKAEKKIAETSRIVAETDRKVRSFRTGPNVSDLVVRCTECGAYHEAYDECPLVRGGAKRWLGDA